MKTIKINKTQGITPEDYDFIINFIENVYFDGRAAANSLTTAFKRSYESDKNKRYNNLSFEEIPF